MTPEEIIAYCQDNGITLEPTERGTIVVQVPNKSLWSDELSAAVKEHKSALLQILNIISIEDFNGHILTEEEANDPSWQWVDIRDYLKRENEKCIFRNIHCAEKDYRTRCLWNLQEGLYRVKEGGWKRVLH